MIRQISALIRMAGLAAARLRHPVARNAAALYAQQIANYILPVLVIPYLARVLHPHAWGSVVFAQGFAMWLSRLLEYGFNLSATRQVAKYRSDEHRMGEIVAGVLGAQMLLAAAAGLAAAISAVTVPSFRDFPVYLGLAWLIAIAQGMNPLWFYQGVEDMRLPAMLSVTGRIIATLGVFLIVKSPDDGWLVLLLQSVAAWISTGTAIFFIYRRVPTFPPGPARAWAALVDGWRVFLLRGSITLYSTANIFLLGLFVPSSIVAYYGGADRISRACFDTLSPVSQALFPHMAHLVVSDRKRAVQFARVSCYVLCGIGSAACLILMLFAPWIIHLLLGPEYKAAVPILRVLSLIPPVAALSNILGVQWMVPLGLERQMNRVILAAGLLNIALVSLLTPRFGGLGMAFAVVAAETTVTVGMFLTLHKLRLNPLLHTIEDFKTPELVRTVSVSGR
jgi:polysaccharide transporter, PST family